MSTIYNIPVIDKCFDIIELLTQNLQGLSMHEIVQQSNTPKTTIYRILLSLTDRGYLVKNAENSRYYLSKRFLKIGLAALGETNMVEVALPQMRLLRDEIGESIMFGMFIQDQPVLIEQVLGSESFAFILRPGSSFTLHASAPGKIFLAYMNQEEREQILKSYDFVRFNDNTIINYPDFIAELDRIREQGFATDRQEELDGVYCIGAPIFNQYSQVVAAVWTSGPSGRIKVKGITHITKNVVDAAVIISKMLGL